MSPLVLASACITERYVEAIIAEHGVTWIPEETSTGASPDTSTTRTSTTGPSSPHDTSTTSSGSAAHDDTSDESTADVPDPTPVTTGSSTDTTIGEPACGNGVVEADEGCDDANTDPADGCDLCVRVSTVFVSSHIFQGQDFGGLFGADQWCRSLAAKADLPRFETFMAWMSADTESAADRLLHSTGRYVLVNGLVVADSWTELTSGHLQRPIDVTEKSETYHGGVYTGTLPDGSLAPGTNFCAGWTDIGAWNEAPRGNSSYKDGLWTFVENTFCGDDMPIYCIEQ